MKKTTIALIALAALAACDSPSADGRQTLITREGATIFHTGAGAPFEVAFRAGFGASEYWCAAGRFAENQRLPTSTRIFRLTPSPRPQGSGVTFTFTPPAGGGQPTGLITLGGDNRSLSSVGARDQCVIVRQRRDRS